MANIRIKTPTDDEATLLQRVRTGLAHVITANEYNSLSAELKAKYYPLYHRADTTYRMKSEFMRARRDPDPTTTSPIRIVPRAAYTPTKTPPSTVIKTTPDVPVVRTDPGSRGTEASKKTTRQILKEASQLTRKRVGVTTQFSRY